MAVKNYHRMSNAERTKMIFFMRDHLSEFVGKTREEVAKICMEGLGSHVNSQHIKTGREYLENAGVELWEESKNNEIFDDDVKVHGHNYNLYITISGPINPDSGFIINLKELNHIVKDKVLSILDHSMIQDNQWFKNKQPSTENLVMFIWDQIDSEISSPAKLYCVKLRETDTIFSEYYGEK